MFQARYYPTGIFLEAGSGSRRSAVWSSIVSARPLLMKGLRIRIRNGYSTDIWQDPWIPDDSRFTVFTPRPPDKFFPMNVADLIDPLTSTWNKHLIEEHLWPIDRERILSIPVGSIYSDDRFVWHYARNGKFSVKTAYHAMKCEQRSDEGDRRGEGSGVDSEEWQGIWKLQLPPKVKMFLWRVCKNIFPYAVELYRRHILNNPFCTRCNSDAETFAHVILKCRGLQDVWSNPPFCIYEVDENAQPWAIYKLFQKKLSKENFLLAMMLWWRMWELRNKEVHGELEGVGSDLVTWAKWISSSLL